MDMDKAFSTQTDVGWIRRFFLDIEDDELVELRQTYILLRATCDICVAHNIRSASEACHLGFVPAKIGQLLNLMSLLTIYASGRYVFRTTRGRLGFALSATQPGDQICFVPGGDNLHVISPHHRRYVAPACVEGLMDDALLDVLPSEERYWQDFRLE